MRPLVDLQSWSKKNWSIPQPRRARNRYKFEVYGVQQLATSKGRTHMPDISRQRIVMYVGTSFGVWQV